MVLYLLLILSTGYKTNTYDFFKVSKLEYDWQLTDMSARPSLLQIEIENRPKLARIISREDAICC